MLAVLIALACLSVSSVAASLFGDLSCRAWADLEYSKKRVWTNAFLAPLSLTHQGLERTKPDLYNEDPNAAEPAIYSIDSFCVSHPELGPAGGAIAYLDALMSK